jgi:hypothetical protein
VAGVDRRRRAQEVADRARQPLRVVHRAGRFERHLAQRCRQRHLPEAVGGLGGEPFAQPRTCLAEARVLDHPRQKLLGRLLRAELVRVVALVLGQQQARLDLEQRGDQDKKLGDRLEIEASLALEMVDICDDDGGELDVAQVDLFAEHER